MKKLIFSSIFYCFIFVFAFLSYAQSSTIVPGGDVSGIWDEAGSPYLVQGHITITSGEQLVIMPGVEVIFQGSYYFDVYGSLQASGTSSDSIFFKAQNPSVKWLGIQFDTESALDPSPSEISYCHFENVANRSITENFGAIKVKQHLMDQIENCTFKNCELGITLSMYSPLFMIKDCFFNNITGAYAVNISTNQLVQDFSILQNKFYNFFNDAIVAEVNRTVLYSINIESNEFINSASSFSKSAIIIDRNDLLEQVVIAGNIFENINHGYPDKSTIQFTDNNDDFEIDFNNNTIEDCGYQESSAGGAYSGGVYVDGCNKINFRDNLFNGNKGYKSGAVFITTNRFSSVTDEFSNNLSFSFADSSETGNGGSIFYNSLSQNGDFKINSSQFNQNNSEKYGGSVYLKITNEFDSIYFENSGFSEGFADYSGGSVAVLIENNIEYSGFFNNTFFGNKATENGGCIWFYSDNPHWIGAFESDNNEVSGDEELDQTETYIYYSSYRLPGIIRFYNDAIENILFGTTYSGGNRVIHFDDHSIQASENVSTVDIRNSQFNNCNRGIFYFSTRHKIDEILLHRCTFSEIISDSTAGISVKANHIGEIRVEAGTYSTLINSLSHGGAMYFTSVLDIERVGVLSFNNELSGYMTCISQGSGGILYARAGRLIGDVEIRGTMIDDSHASGNGGNFYFESAANGDLVQTLSVIENNVTGLSGANQGSGGFLHYSSPAELSSLEITSNLMGSVNSQGHGGAFYVSANEVGPVMINANYFAHMTAEAEGNAGADGGVFCILSENDIESIDVMPGENSVVNHFVDCFSDDNGGCIYARAKGLIGPVVIDSAMFQNSHAGKKGGSVCLISENTAKSSRAQSIRVANNTITGTSWISSSDMDGGFLYYSSPSTIQSAEISGNTISDLTAGASGGAFCIEAGAVGPFQVVSNFLQNLVAGGKGGGFRVSAGDIGPVTLLNNEFNQVATQNDPSADGGVLSLDSSDDIEGIYLISSPAGDSNVFNGCISSGSGGCVYASAAGSIGDIIIRNTNISNSYATGDGGNFYIRSGDANASSQGLDVSDNRVTGNSSQSQTGGAGGFIYYESPAPLDTLKIISNTLKDIYSAANGGAMYVSVSDINTLGMTGNSFVNIRSVSENGGVLYLESNKDVGAMKIISTAEGDTNIFSQCFAGLNGGCIYTSADGLIGDITVTGSKFNNCYSGEGGGSFFMKSEQANTGLDQQKIIIHHNNITGSVQSITGGNGGFMSYITPAFVSQVEIVENTVTGLRIYGGGGYFHLDAGMIGTATISENIFKNFTCTNPGPGLDGGAIFITSGIQPVAHLQFESNELENIHGFGNGGALYIAGKGTAYAVISNNTWKNITSWNFGGMACFYNSELTGTLDMAGNTFEITQSFTEKPLRAGAFFVSGLDSVICSTSGFKDLASVDNGGCISMENTLYAEFNGCAFNNCQAGITGGAINYSGDGQAETLRVNACSFYHNFADQKGGALFVSQIDHVFLGEEGLGNIFSVNQNNAGGNCMGGAVFASNISSFSVKSSRFFGNSSMDGGGICITEAGTVDFNGNAFLGNIAFREGTVGGNGGALRLMNVKSGVLHSNGFQMCSSDSHGGAIDIYNISSDNDTLYLTDNYFYMNSSREGGAMLSNYPLNIKRNQFTENECRDLNPPNEFVGSAISLYYKGVHSVIYNSIFDYNRSENITDGSIYFRQESLPTPYTYSIQNCTFLNGGNNKSIYSENNIKVVNSLFQNYAKAAKFDPEYFNNTVTVYYSDLVFADNWENNNFDSVVSFESQNCYNVACDQPVVDNGAPGDFFFDNHMPPGCGEPRNDVGVTGGPHNPDFGSLILCEPIDTLSVKVNAVQDCDTYTFTCTENTDLWDNYFWYLPNNEILPNHSSQITVQLDLPPGKAYIRLLVEDTNAVPSQFAFGIDSITVKKLSIESLEVANALPNPNGNYYDVDEIPFTFQINAELIDKPVEFDHSWIMGESSGVVLDIFSTETGISVTITEINPGEDEKYFTVTYIAVDEYCDFQVEETLRVDIQSSCDIPSVTFITNNSQIQTNQDSIIVVFSQNMLHYSGAEINSNNITDIYTLINVDNSENLFAADYDIFSIHPTGIIFYIDPVYLDNHVGQNLVLTIKGDMVMSADCKVKCNGSPASDPVPITIGIEEIQGDFVIFPNPARSIVYIQTGNVRVFDIHVYAVPGKQLMAFENVTAGTFELNVMELPAGIYFIHLADRRNHRVSSYRIVKE